MADPDAAIRAKLASWDDDPCVVVGWSELRGAIATVLDLNREDSGFCYACATDFSVAYGEPTAQFEVWPCPTVRAIAEKLGVEVPDARN